MKLALVQHKRVKGVEENIRRAVDNLSTVSADIVLLPEYWLGVEPVDPVDVVNKLPDLPLLIPGAFLTREGLTRSYVMSKGEVVGVCDKMFPSKATGERGFVKAGGRTCVIPYQGVKLSVVICVDLAYPELARYYAMRGVDVLLNPANITVDRIPTWRSLVVARAFENHMYVAFANNTGTAYADGREVRGCSTAVNPHGEIVLSAGEEEGIYYVNLNLGEIEEARRRRGFLEDLPRALALLGEFSDISQSLIPRRYVNPWNRLE